MAWKMWNAIMPRLLGKRANTKACRPLLPPAIHPQTPQAQRSLCPAIFKEAHKHMPCVTNMLF